MEKQEVQNYFTICKPYCPGFCFVCDSVSQTMTTQCLASPSWTAAPRGEIICNVWSPPSAFLNGWASALKLKPQSQLCTVQLLSSTKEILLQHDHCYNLVSLHADLLLLCRKNLKIQAHRSVILKIQFRALLVDGSWQFCRRLSTKLPAEWLLVIILHIMASSSAIPYLSSILKWM